MLLELLERYPDQPDVTFVLLTEDRARIRKVDFEPHITGPPSNFARESRHAIPFALSFARHDDFFDVSVPDPSFYGWPEMRVAPHWMLTASAENRLRRELFPSSDNHTTNPQFLLPPSQTSWDARANAIHWRGGMGRSGHLREAIVACAKRLSRHRRQIGQLEDAALQFHEKLDIYPRTKQNWEHPLAMASNKVALFIQGEGFTSTKQRTLATGSLPVFAELTKHDGFFGRFLEEDIHFKRVYVLEDAAPKRNGSKNNQKCWRPYEKRGYPCVFCNDITSHLHWAVAKDTAAAARRVARNAELFASGAFGRDRLLEYISFLLREVHRLQKRAGMNRVDFMTSSASEVNKRNLVDVMERGCRNAGEIRNRRISCKESMALAMWWANQPPEAYMNTAYPPCNGSICAKCCDVNAK